MRKKKKERFPRLGLSRKELFIEKLLHHTYNELAKKRFPAFMSRFNKYDIYKTKRGEKRAQFWFFILAKKLLKERIDPITYLKVLSTYGKFESSYHLPNPGWLAKDDAIEKFRWFSAKLARQAGKEGYDKLISPGKVDRGTIKKSVSSSVRLIEEAKRNFPVLDVQTLVEMNMDSLSLWFLAVFYPLVKDRLRNENAEKILQRVRHLLGNRQLLKVAVKASKDLRDGVI